ncbi:hypothetical protein BBP00_00001696 [Phytophthora kernoviae]|uniref:Uncharacterized protein n=1 Tax=Phytophthora kernoviae TaxID=325452 RepID=A0A3F2RZL1_9STRA|nr:hypothetical protein BBP00_00001696 [Phytophthora kernoviae]
MATNHLLATPAFALPLDLSSDNDSDDNKEHTGVYSFGQNTYGELALGDTFDRNTPTRVDLGNGNENKLVADVACGNEQTGILFADGDVYTCGYNDSGDDGACADAPVLSESQLQTQCSSLFWEWE